MSYDPWAAPPSKPLIEGAKNVWRNEKWALNAENKVDRYNESEDEDEYTEKLRFQRPSPQSRRQIILAIVLLLCAWTTYTQLVAPWRADMAEDAVVEASIHEKPLGNMAAHQPLAFENIVLLEDLNEKYLPKTGKHHKSHEHGGSAGRLVIVGDVHGMKDSLVQLLIKVDFDKNRDHLICAGDMISKGPDSVGVINFLMGLGESVSAVRGNHEDRILLAWDSLHSRAKKAMLADSSEEEVEESEEKELGKAKKGEEKDRVLAKQLRKAHVKWLKKLPVMLRVGKIEGMGEVVVVHAGLVPGLELKSQDPYFVMNMRTMDLDTRVPSEEREGTSWTKFWNHHQSSLPSHDRSTVIYGHDSKRGLNIQKYSKGIDTGCLKGGELTALVIEGGKDEAKQRLVHVKCHDGRP